MIDPVRQSKPAESDSSADGLIHDLRTPLNQIIGYSEMLIEQAQEEGQTALAADLAKIHGAGQQLLAVVNNNIWPDRVIPKPQLIEEASEEILPLNEEEMDVHPSSFIIHDSALANEAVSGLLMVVDDNEANRDVLSRRLERQGYKVATAENGRRALEMLKECTFDLVLLDILMPEMDGYEVLQHLKADATWQHIPVIMVSALGELDSVARCIEMGADDYLPKPFNPTILKARIGSCLEKKRAREREIRLFDELQQNYKRLQELERLRDDLTHMIIHDLRTPLTSVIMGMQTLEMVGKLNPAQQEIMAIAVGGGRTLLGMINDLLDVEKLESGAMQLNYKMLSGADVIAAAIRQVDSFAKTRNLTLIQQIEPSLPDLLGDENKLIRTLVNLLGNAIKFTPAGGIVTVAVHFNGQADHLTFSVSDTGEGIPPEAFERIFEKFGQVESREGGRTMSTGLGLTFCRLAVNAHGGHIWVESELGKGSKFSFTIPLGSV